MAVNDFWRRLSRDLTNPELDSGLYITPILFEAGLYDAAVGGGINMAQIRASFNLAAGTSAGDELTDLAQSIASIVNAGNLPDQRERRLRVVKGVIAAATLASRRAKVPSNPYPDGNSVRLRAKAYVTLEGRTPTGTLAAP